MKKKKRKSYQNVGDKISYNWTHNSDIVKDYNKTIKSGNALAKLVINRKAI